ncbi:hypothetical protein RvY_06188 [Ramazzottius varieornatus]|uniref:Uncharacterized protein n=1 Tax=Ramazzottius varieornatus TaxID=947166 RepID=A0A1D1UXP9_RAMVA|nr:hypothetical protein RvY_06188 [Ramazzottius varieornatus]
MKPWCAKEAVRPSMHDQLPCSNKVRGEHTGLAMQIRIANLSAFRPRGGDTSYYRTPHDLTKRDTHIPIGSLKNFPTGILTLEKPLFLLDPTTDSLYYP